MDVSSTAIERTVGELDGGENESCTKGGTLIARLPFGPLTKSCEEEPGRVGTAAGAVRSNVTDAGYAIGAEPTCDPMRAVELKTRVRDEDESAVGRKRNEECGKTISTVRRCTQAFPPRLMGAVCDFGDQERDVEQSRETFKNGAERPPSPRPLRH